MDIPQIQYEPLVPPNLTSILQKKPQHRSPLKIAFALILLGCCRASFSQTVNGVTFSPNVINFGLIPSHEQPTQLLTVKFDRALFTSDHLPLLSLQGPNGPALTLFSRSVSPGTTTLVYRVKLLDDGQYGPFQYHLVLGKEGAAQTGDATLKYVVDSGVLVQGEIMQGLEGSSEAINFGTVRHRRSAVRGFSVGFYHSNFIGENEAAGKSRKTGDWDMMRSLLSMTAASTSPDFAVIKKSEFGLNASAWESWQIILSPNAPQKKLEATLTFQTADGYFLTVPVTADLSGPGYPIPPWEPTNRKKH